MSHVSFGKDLERVRNVRAVKLVEQRGVPCILDPLVRDFSSGRAVRTTHLFTDKLGGSFPLPGPFRRRLRFNRARFSGNFGRLRHRTYSRLRAGIPALVIMQKFDIPPNETLRSNPWGCHGLPQLTSLSDL